MPEGLGTGRALATVALALAAIAVGVTLLSSGGDGYRVHAHFVNASQLVKGDLVQVAGVEVGTVSEIDITPDGQADLTLDITDDTYAPLRAGTKATVRQASLSGVANRYVDLRLPGGDGAAIADDGVIPTADTTSAVDLDEVFNTFDPKARKALSGVIRGFANQYDGQAAAANAGWFYLNPSLAATSRLFREVNQDTPLLQRFIRASSNLVTHVAARRDDVAGLVDHLATTTGAIGREDTSLRAALNRLPGFMRQTDATFANLRGALDDLDPLVSDSKPVAKKLQPFLAALRPLARDARPTLQQLAPLIRRGGADNDLVDATRLSVPLANVATQKATINGAERDGALPETVKALDQATPELGFARPYAVDLTGWFDDFGHSGIYDALGGASRPAPYVNAFTNVNGTLKPILDPLVGDAAFKAAASLNQRNRCPGAAERGTIWQPTKETCDPTQGPLGP